MFRNSLRRGASRLARFPVGRLRRLRLTPTHLRDRVLAAPINSSRHYLEEFAREAGQQGTDASFRVLDVGAGPAPYRRLFAHVTYETSDMKRRRGIDHVCDVSALPMPDDTYDLVFCSQVLEHVPEPVRALDEIRRVLKPGGTAWMSAPLFFEEHQKPYDFYRYTKFAWVSMAERAGLQVEDVSWLEGAYGTSAYQLQMAAGVLPPRMLVQRIMLTRLARKLARLDVVERVVDRGMPKNYRVRLRKP